MSVCPSFRLFVLLSVWNKSAPTEQILIQFDIWVFFENGRENSIFIKIGQE